MHDLYFVLLLLGVIMFFAAACEISTGRLNLVALGLFFFALVPLIQNIKAR